MKTGYVYLLKIRGIDQIQEAEFVAKINGSLFFRQLRFYKNPPPVERQAKESAIEWSREVCRSHPLDMEQYDVLLRNMSE